MCIIIMNEAGLRINNMQWVVSVTHCAINNSTMSYKNYPLRQTENLLLYKTKVFVFINSLVVKGREVKKTSTALALGAIKTHAQLELPPTEAKGLTV